MTPSKVRILLADDHAVVRRGLRLVLEAQADLEVVAEAGDGIEAVQAALAQEVDLAILDVTMPRMTGLHAARELRRHRPKLRILMLSMHQNERYLHEALKAGACGYVAKAVADRDLVQAVRAAIRGDRPAPRSIAGVDPPREQPLTPREQEVVKLVAEGYSSREIADTLVISEKTVERHRANVLDKLDMRGRVEMTRYAIRYGLVEP
jgi:DNA-binding NarL/FixJ family response regulator